MTISVSPSMLRRLFLGAVLASAVVLPSSAQTGIAVPPAPRGDTSIHRLNVDAARVQAGRFTYRVQLARDTVTSALGDQEFTIATQDYAGTPAFLLARSGMQGVAAVSDTLFVRRDDLRPLHWLASHGAARAAVEFTGDSVYGAMTSPLGRQNVVLPNRADLLVNTMAVDVVLGALPLGSAWRDSATMIVLDAGGSAITPATLAVEGEERVTVPAGEFDCWIVTLETERASERVWLTKQGQIVVRSEQILPELDGATLIRVLVQSDNPALLSTSARIPR